MIPALLALLLLALATPAWGAFPTVSGTPTTSEDIDCNPTPGTGTITLPASVPAGKLLVVVVGGDTNITSATWPGGGWVEKADTDGGTQILTIGYKFTDGTEGGTSIGITCAGSSDDIHAVVFLIDGAHASTPPEVGTGVSGTSTDPDCPAVTASWGSADNLWICAFSTANSANASISNPPSGYGNQANQVSTSAQASVYTARRTLAAASEDPTVVSPTLASSVGWTANTIVIRPAAAVAVAGPLVNATPLKRLVGGGLLP